MNQFKKIACIASLWGFLAPSIAVSKCSDVFKIAVIDTGFGFLGHGDTSHLCKYGHRDFTQIQQFMEDVDTVDPVPLDTHGHGTNIAGVIDKQLKSVSYCIVVLKIYDFQKNSGLAEIAAIKYATNIKVDVINLSGGGTEYLSHEQEAVTTYLDNGGMFVTVAGNEGKDLQKEHYYPAMDDDRVIVVGSVDENGKQLPTSNYGTRVDVWERGSNVEGNGIILTGTSQATAVTTGKLVRLYDKYCKNPPTKRFLASVSHAKEKHVLNRNHNRN